MRLSAAFDPLLLHHHRPVCHHHSLAHERKDARHWAICISSYQWHLIPLYVGISCWAPVKRARAHTHFHTPGRVVWFDLVGLLYCFLPEQNNRPRSNARTLTRQGGWRRRSSLYYMILWYHYNIILLYHIIIARAGGGGDRLYIMWYCHIIIIQYSYIM